MTGPGERLRRLCLACPEAVEQLTWDRPTYRVRTRIFAMERDEGGTTTLWVKAPDGSQAVLVGADPDRFFVPPYLGPKGWVGMRLDDGADWAEVETLVRRSYRLIAPKRLAVLLEEPGDRATRPPGPQGVRLRGGR